MNEPNETDLVRWSSRRIDELDRQQLRRRLPAIDGVAGRTVTMDGRELVNFGSNDYLGLAADGCLVEAAVEATRTYGTGATGSRLLTGNHVLYEKLERAVARMKGAEAALVYPTGYQANLGCLSVLCSSADVVVADRLIHASLIDGVVLSGARLRRYAHNDVAHLKRQLVKAAESVKPGGRIVVVTESIFSMDGDLAPLEAIQETARRHHAVLAVDDAHGTGVMGVDGHGAVEGRLDMGEDVVVLGTFSKALGSLGGFVAGPQAFVDLLATSSRGLIYSTGLPPAVAAANLRAVEAIGEQPQRRRRVLHLAEMMRDGLRRLGYDTGASAGPIVPVGMGQTDRVLAVCEHLRQAGYYAPAIRPPTVPPGGSRLRLSLSAAHTDEDVTGFLAALEESGMAGQKLTKNQPRPNTDGHG